MNEPARERSAPGSGAARRKMLARLAALLLSPIASGAAPRVARVVVELRGGAPWRDRVKALFAQRGWREGENLALTFVGAGPGPAEMERDARAIIASRPDAILVPGGELLLHCQRLSSDVPLVFWSLGADPVRMGLVESLGRPGRNVTGTTNRAIEVVGKGWELLKEIRPQAKRVVSLEDREFGASAWKPLLVEAQEHAASRLALERVEITVSRDEEFVRIAERIRRAAPDLIDVTEGYDWPYLAELMKYLERSGIPALWETSGLVRKGGLVSLIGSLDEALEEAVGLVARILQGERAGTIPVHEVKRFILAINLATARAMGLTIPPAVLMRADVLVPS